jgi:hypothetical protein
LRNGKLQKIFPCGFSLVGLPLFIVKEQSYPGRPLIGFLTNSRNQAFKRW